MELSLQQRENSWLHIHPSVCLWEGSHGHNHVAQALLPDIVVIPGILYRNVEMLGTGYYLQDGEVGRAGEGGVSKGLPLQKGGHNMFWPC